MFRFNAQTPETENKLKLLCFSCHTCLAAVLNLQVLWGERARVAEQAVRSYDVTASRAKLAPVASDVGIMQSSQCQVGVDHSATTNHRRRSNHINNMHCTKLPV